MRRYHNTLPDDCCTDDGILSVSWSEAHVTSRFPTGGNDCAGAPVATIRLRYVVCWPIPDTSGDGIVIDYDATDATTARLADVADCVLRALDRLTCNPDPADPLSAAVLRQIPARWFQTLDVTPLPNLGGCTGVSWRLYAGVRTAAVMS